MAIIGPTERELRATLAGLRRVAQAKPPAPPDEDERLTDEQRAEIARRFRAAANRALTEGASRRDDRGATGAEQDERRGGRVSLGRAASAVISGRAGSAPRCC